MDLPLIDDFQQLFLNDVPLLDVRAPVEYSQGAFPNTCNIPLINDEERHAIGIRYNEMGQEQAIDLGHELVQGDKKAQRISDWITFMQQHPQGVLYCFRGGMRSRISQQWIFEQSGIAIPRIKGGYKALRRYLIDQLDNACASINPIVLSGRTGTGKTLLLQRLEHKIDLEQIYHHRGSAFGKYIDPQPTQIDVENALSIALIKLRHHHITQFLLEDEAQSIGSRRIPNNLFDVMKQSPVVVLETDFEERVLNIFQEYIIESLAQYQNRLGEEQGFNVWSGNLLNALQKIQRRLGGLNYRNIHSIMSDAVEQHRVNKDPINHQTWISQLLTDYYDPMYDYQLDKKMHRVVMRGTTNEILEYLSQQHGIH